jgi:hypothetical protein
VRDLIGWTNGEKLVEGHPFRDIRAQPMAPTRPEIWILGSSDYGAQVAAYFGLPFCFAHFITEGRGLDQAFGLYREGYRPSEAHPRRMARFASGRSRRKPRPKRARLFSSREISRLNRDKGIFAPCPHPRKPPPWCCPTPTRRGSNGCGHDRFTERRTWLARNSARSGRGISGGRNRHPDDRARSRGAAAILRAAGGGIWYERMIFAQRPGDRIAGGRHLRTDDDRPNPRRRKPVAAFRGQERAFCSADPPERSARSTASRSR